MKNVNRVFFFIFIVVCFIAACGETKNDLCCDCEPDGEKPPAPRDLTSVSQTSTSIDTYWQFYGDIDNCLGFKLERQVGRGFMEIADLDNQRQGYIDLNLAPDTFYQYRVRAYNKHGYSPYSETVEESTIDPDCIPTILHSVSNLDVVTPTAIAYGDGALWVSDENTRKVYKLNPVDASILCSFEGPGYIPPGTSGPKPNGLSWDNGALWVVQYPEGDIHKIDPATACADGNVKNAVLETIDSVGWYMQGLAHNNTHLWGMWGEGGNVSILKMNRTDGSVECVIDILDTMSPMGAEWVDGYLWAAIGALGDRNIHKIDTDVACASGVFLGSVVKDLHLQSIPAAVTFDGANVWYVGYGSNMFVKASVPAGCGFP